MMVNINANIKKVCSFYVSDWHFITMLLPHINEKINEEVKIATILEEDATELIEKLLEKLNLKNTKKIKDINWKAVEEIDNKIGSILDNDQTNTEIIVNGTREFIKEVNSKIEEYININNKEKQNITIINCYDVYKYEDSIREILEKHDKVLNTSGEKEKEEYLSKMEVKQ